MQGAGAALGANPKMGRGGSKPCSRLNGGLISRAALGLAEYKLLGLSPFLLPAPAPLQPVENPTVGPIALSSQRLGIWRSPSHLPCPSRDFGKQNPPHSPSPRVIVPAHPALSLSLQVILKDLEVLAEIASSPAGQTEGHGPSETTDPRPGQVELHIPGRNSQLSASGKCPLLLLDAFGAESQSQAAWCWVAPVSDLLRWKGRLLMG